MDEIERQLAQNFEPIEQNFKNMQSGLSWLWSKIYALLLLILTPVEKAFNWFIGRESKQEEDWF